MTVEFNKVSSEDFETFSRESPTYVLIENHVINIGGGGKEGIKYKTEVLKKAGWKYGDLTSYGAHSKIAAKVFNRVRKVLMKTEDIDKIIKVMDHLKQKDEVRQQH